MPKEYTLIVISPLYARVFSFFLTLPNTFNEVHLDNLYMIKTFAHLSCTHQVCVKVQGVYRAEGRLIPREVLKIKLNNKKEADIVG